MYNDMDYLVSALLGIYSAIGGLSSVIWIVSYVFTAIAVYQLSKTLNLPSPGLAWVPIVRVYALGRVAREAIRATAPGKKARNYGALLLTLNLVGGLSMLIGGVLAFAGVFAGLGDWMYDFGDLYGGLSGMSAVDLDPGFGMTYDPDGMLALMIPGVLLVLVGSIVMIVYSVFYYIALYNVYKAFNPENATVFEVLSILLSVTTPFLLFSIRNRAPVMAAPAGYGYPPQQPQYPPYAQPAQPYTTPYAQPQQPYTTPGQPQQPYTTPEQPQQPYTTPEYTAPQQTPPAETPANPPAAPAEEDPWNRPE